MPGRGRKSVVARRVAAAASVAVALVVTTPELTKASPSRPSPYAEVVVPAGEHHSLANEASRALGAESVDPPAPDAVPQLGLIETDTDPASTPAPPTAPTTTLAPRPVGDRVLAAIAFPWQAYLPGWTIEFVGPRRGFRGITYTAERRIEIFVRPDLGFEELVHVTAHELGHALDVTLLDDEQRDWWMHYRGGTESWWVSDGASDFASGAGDWAECFAWWQTQRGGFFSEVAGPPDVASIQLMADMIGG
ncbi:MAG: hypothetical protein KDB20_15650 [Microthrixaceae bacterium]|nr:hypothetical protein [Microthrixaceae bacterium]